MFTKMRMFCAPEDIILPGSSPSPHNADLPLGVPPIGGSAPPVPAPAPQRTAPPASTGDEDVRELPDGRVQVLSSKAYKKMRESFYARGQREALVKLDADAQELGYKSHADMLANLKAGRANGGSVQRPNQQTQNPKRGGQQAQPAREAAPMANTNQPRTSKLEMRRIDRMQKEREIDRKARIMAERRARQANAELEAERVRNELVRSAMMAGVQDVDYAVTLLERSIRGKDEAALSREGFDEAAFFTNLRQTHPYIFGEQVRPITTGTGAGGAPPAPSAATITQNAAEASKFDGMKATRQEVAARMKKLGLSSAS